MATAGSSDRLMWGQPAEQMSAGLPAHNEELYEDTRLISRIVDNVGGLFGAANSDVLDFWVCHDPGDEILEVAVTFTESSLTPPSLLAGNNLSDLNDAIAAREPIGAEEVAPVPVEGETTISTTIDSKYVFVDASSGDVTVNLYHSATYGAKQITIKNTGASGTVTIEADYGNTIEGGTSLVLSNQYDFVTLVPATAGWWIVATNF